MITTIKSYLTMIKKDIEQWNEDVVFKHTAHWFSGEKETSSNPEYLLLPNIYKKTLQNNLEKKELGLKDFNSIENKIVQDFRMRAKAFDTPSYERIDEWLFLMHHVGAYTRLLDWTEGALIALFFAVYEEPKTKEKPVVWMINPVVFNLVVNKRLFLPLSWNDSSCIYEKESGNLIYYYPNDKLFHKEKLRDQFERKNCPGNILSAFEAGASKYEEDYPLALKPQYTQSRLSNHKTSFTIHGKYKQGIFDILKTKTLGNKDYEEIFENISG